MEAAVRRQHTFFRSGQSRDTDYRQRQLQKLRQLLVQHEEELMEALDHDFRKPAFETYATELMMIHAEIDLLCKKLERWSRRRRVRSSLLNFPARSYIYPEPHGVCLVIGAWNYPLNLTLVPAAGALAAGNCVIIKPSEIASRTSSLLARILNAAFDPGYLRVVEGDADDTQALLRQPLDYIFYTGGAAVGKKIMEAAARQLTPVTLELGGKSPAIVGPTADLALAARRIAWGKYINAGQTCVSPDYVYVHKSRKEAFCAELSSSITRFYGSDPAQSDDYARIISDKHFGRLQALITPQHLYCGGQTQAEDRYIAPTVLHNLGWDAPAMQEEIFGPVLPVLTYQRLDEVIRAVNHRPRPLALYVFSSRQSVWEQVIAQIRYGGGCINDTVAHLGDLNLPFGGSGSSGFGSYHGKASFELFSHHKSIMKKATWLDVPLRYPPYNGNLKWLKKMTRWI